MEKAFSRINATIQKVTVALLIFCLTAVLIPNITVHAAMQSNYRMNIGEVRTVTTDSGGTNYIWSCDNLFVFVIPCVYDKLFSSRDGFLAYKKGNEYGLLPNPITPPKAVADIVPEKPENPVTPPEKDPEKPVTPPEKESEGTAATAPKITLLSAKSKAKGKMTVTWKSGACSGYQIAYSRSKSFPTAKTQLAGIGGKVSKKTLNGLAKGKTYYVRVRAYKTVKGKTCYGVWSAAKRVKIKK